MNFNLQVSSLQYKYILYKYWEKLVLFLVITPQYYTAFGNPLLLLTLTETQLTTYYIYHIYYYPLQRIQQGFHIRTLQRLSIFIENIEDGRIYYIYHKITTPLWSIQLIWKHSRHMEAVWKRGRYCIFINNTLNYDGSYPFNRIFVCLLEELQVFS